MYFVFSDKKEVFFNIGQLVPWLSHNERAVGTPRHFGFTGR